MSGRGRGGPPLRGGGYVFKGGRGGRDGGKSGQTAYQRQGNMGAGKGNKNGNFIRKGGPSKERVSENDALEAKLGFTLFKEGEPRLGWLMNFSTTTVEDSETGISMSAINCYFMCQDGSTFKAQQRFAPYFYLATKDKMEMEVESYLRRRYEGQIADVFRVEKEDLDLKNHLSGLRRPFLKLTFNNVQDLMEVRKDIQPVIDKNKAKLAAAEAYETFQQAVDGPGTGATRLADFMEHILEMREYDVPYHVRFAIDNDMRSGQWYTVTAEEGHVRLTRRADLLQRAEPRICAFDIETTKLPLKFPDSSYDSIMMISYMIDGQGYLVINRETVGSDIQDLEYTPKPEFEGPFTVINVPDERALLRYWFDHMRRVQPGIYVTYNGDFFDWPFIETRAAVHGMTMYDEIGFRCDGNQGECRSKFALHLDAFAWVKRDSYLPQGSQGLKAVTKAKLGYDPLEVNPEDMVRFAMEDPQTMASYSVSDAVATYYLYTTYVHPFIFSLATVIPMSPDEVLRKGSGTLCEMLLMVEAFRGNIVCPNKHASEKERFYKGCLLDSETYIGGHVECLESGVFRSDLPTRFRLVPSAYQGLIDNLDRDLRFAIEEEAKMTMDEITNYDEIKHQIQTQLENLRDVPNREERPVIYHLDVAAMYPNIILTNRLQPPSIVTEDVCAGCDFNRPDKTCLRQMEWTWRGEHFMASRSEYYQVKNQIESEQFPPAHEGGPPRFFKDLDPEQQALKLKARLKSYTQKVYRKVLDKPVMEQRTASVCMRENPFYVDTVKSFRDRRYEYKALNKMWKARLGAARARGNPIEIQEAADMCVVYDSLQLAHKCILNSFYGYVMRKGARWYSMEMAGVVTYTGAKIIQAARVLVEQIGKPLELDTDGIWCALPASFPENFAFTTTTGKRKLTISYPCVMLNVDVFVNNTNDQYQTLKDPLKRTYTTSSECSISFEVDGPYKAMILPASKEEGVLIKKRYAVFNDDGTLAELKGFEVKRRGELKLIKVFQSEVFENFLAGDSLEDCYKAVAAVANRWLDMLDTRGVDLTDEELLEYISEQTTMSKSLADYGEQKSCATTTARRLADFLGTEMVKDKGLLCRYIVARSPEGAPVSERAIPVAIFETDADVQRSYLRRWCKEGGDLSIRTIVDWAYYTMRLGGSIQKIITIPAAMQKVANPVPRVTHPEWLYKKLRDKNDKYQQRSIEDMFSKPPPQTEKRLSLPGTQGRPPRVAPVDPSGLDEMIEGGGEGQPEAGPAEGLGGDLEDFGGAPASKKAKIATVRRKSRGPGEENEAGGGPWVDRDGGAEAEPSRGRGMAGEAAPWERSPTPDRDEDYAAWLEHKKRKWKSARAGKKKRRLEEQKEAERAARDAGRRGDRGTAPAARKKQPGLRAGLGAFVRQADDVTRLTWQILQLAPGRRPGEFTAWIIAGGRMISVPLTVPRRFYLNKRTPEEESDAVGVRVSRTLPHARPVYNLLQIEVPEDYFHVSARMLATHLSDPDVEGVYETRVPLALNAVLQLGCVATVEPAAREKRLTDGFGLADLRPKSAAEAVYLDPSKTSLSYVYLYHSQADARGLLCLHLPDSGKGLVVVVNPFANREVSATSMRRHFDEAFRENLEDRGEEGAPPEIAFKVEYVRTLADAGRALQSALLDYRDQNRGPMVAVVESLDVTSLLTHVHALNKLPRIGMPPNAADSQYQALGWQPAAARLAAMRTAAAELWLKARVDMARYVHVPLGNIAAEDWVLFCMDAFYARALREHDMLLWTSDAGVPDLGGVAEEEEASFADEVQQPELKFPGAYRSITIEINIHNLAVSALIKAGTINELEGGSLLGLDALQPDAPDLPMGARTSYDDSALAGAAFKVLKQVASRWLLDALKYQNLYADQLLQNVYRWLCSPQSTLHDPALHRLLHKVMHKLFALLISDVRKLGAQIVFADFSRVIVATGKTSLAAARGYCDYLLAALKKRDLFEYLAFDPSRYWYSLLFMDKYNYGGLVVTESNPAGDPPESGHLEEEEEAGPAEGKAEILMDWNVAEFLPEKLKDYFYLHVSAFIFRPWKHAQETERERARLRAEATNPTPSVSILAAVDSTEEENAYLRQQVSSYFTDKLLRIVRDIQRHVASRSTAEDDDDDVSAATRKFPELAGSHLELGSPALEFVKAVCAVMLLDKAAEQSVMLMRKNLLRLVHVREFSPEAVFRDPCLSFTLPNVICSYCNDCRDLDLCRDPLLLRREWRCAAPACAHPYDRQWVENALLQIVRQRSRMFQLQDLKCRKCRQVKSAHLTDQCRCAGSFVCTESPSTFRQRMRVFHNIAKYHGFELLQECVDWLLETTPKN